MKIFNQKSPTYSPTVNSHISYFNRAFTLVEMLIIAPIVILVIGIFISAIVGMTGEVLSVRAATDLSLKVQNALDSIDADVKLSGGYLVANNITLSTGQGYDDAVSTFKNANDVSIGPMLILNTYATTENPSVSSRNYVYAKNQPNACDSAIVSQNSKVMMNTIYFVKTVNGVSSLWRRIVAPSNYATNGCSVPWQKPTCTTGYSASFCKADDTKLVEGVLPAGFIIDYYTSSNSSTAIADASNAAKTDSERQSAMKNANSINVSITASKMIAGRSISKTVSTRTTGPNDNTDNGILTYKRPITINNAGGLLTNYPVQITPFADSAFLNNTGLVGSWHLNEGSGTKTIDSSGNNNTGTLNGSNYWSTSGKNGNSFTNSSTNSISLSNGNDANVTGDISVEAWIYPTSFSANNTIVHKNSQYTLAIDASGNVAWADSSNWSYANFVFRNIGLVTNQWQHIVATKTGGTVKIYLNGVEKVSQAFGGVLTSTANVMSIGCYSNATDCTGSYFLGKIDEVKVYSRAISGTEVTNRYGTAGIPKVRSDYADLYFTDATGTIDYPYWQDADNKYWVNVPSIASGNSDIYMHYGNPNAISSSSGTNTFEFFDDFKGTSINSTKWTELDTKNAIAQNAGLNLTSVTTAWDSALISNVTFARSVGLAVSGSFKAGSSVGNMMVGWENNQTTDPLYSQLVHGFYFNGGTLTPIYEGGSSYVATGTYATNSVNYFRVRLKSTGADYLNNGSSVYSGTGGNFTTTPMRIAITQYAQIGTINNIYVHKNTTPEPTFVSVGSETSN